MAQLPNPARYLPFASGRYEVKAGFFPLTKDFGNGRNDTLMLQLDTDYAHYRAVKLAARAERLAKYYITRELPDAHLWRITEHLARLLVREHPAWFTLSPEASGWMLHCRLSDERLVFDGMFRLLAVHQAALLDPPYVDGLDALACQLQEDLALLKVDDEGNTVSALHLCFPNHLAAQDKIGKDFIGAHAPVPGMAALNKSAQGLLQATLAKGPFVRFAWGMATDRRLNHHPEAPPDWDAHAWQGRSLDDAQSEIYLRIERQTLSGLADIATSLFTIHSYFLNVAELTADPPLLNALIAALTTIPQDSLHYKGLAPYHAQVLRKLTAWRDHAFGSGA